MVEVIVIKDFAFDKLWFLMILPMSFFDDIPILSLLSKKYLCVLERRNRHLKPAMGFPSDGLLLWFKSLRFCLF